MKFFDAHAHMYLLPEMDCKSVGVLNCGTSFETNKKVLSSNYFKAIGWWPNEESDFNQIKEQVTSGVCAVGEIGLDLHHFKSLEAQLVQFKQMLSLAQKEGLPVSVHSRNAEAEVLKVLSGYDLKVVLHAFSGKLKLVDEAVSKGYYFSIPSHVVRSSQAQGLVGRIPVEQLLTESDSPYLGLVKGALNTPLSIPDAVKKVSELKGENVKRVLLKNARSVFVLKK